MRRSICQRIARLEERAGITSDPPPILIIFFKDYVERAGQRFERAPAESEGDFRNRVIRDLRAAGSKQRIISICFTDRRNDVQID
jgi:hypothetical protein